MSEKTTALQPAGVASNILANVTNPLEAAQEVGKWLVDSGSLGYDVPYEHGNLIALSAMFSGENPLKIAREFHIIQGKLSKRPEAMHKEFRMAGGRIEWKKTNSKIAEADFTWEGSTVTYSFTIEQAKQRGYLSGKNKHNWEKQPEVMLRWRLVSETLRMIAPEISLGFYTKDEILDYLGDGPTTDTSEQAPLFGDAPERYPENNAPDESPEPQSGPEDKGTPMSPDQSKAEDADFMPVIGDESVGDRKTRLKAITWELKSMYPGKERLVIEFFAVQKKWLSKGDRLSKLNDDQLDFLWKNWDLFNKSFKAWLIIKETESNRPKAQ